MKKYATSHRWSGLAGIKLSPGPETSGSQAIQGSGRGLRLVPCKRRKTGFSGLTRQSMVKSLSSG